MSRVARVSAAVVLCLALAACNNDAADDAPDPEAVAESGDSAPEGTTTPPSEPTELFIARVAKSTPAEQDGCLDSVRTNWQPDSGAKTQRLCGVQNGEETWFSIDPSTAFAATVTQASAGVLETSSSWGVTITLDDESARRFGQLATKLLELPSPEPIALIVQGEVVAAPIPTPGLEDLTELQIAANFSRQDAEQLAAGLGAQ